MLTRRAQEYEKAIASVGTPLARAAVVELEPVSHSEVSTYLTTGLVERELLSAYLPTRYRSAPEEPGAPKLKKYRPEQAQRWLRALARLMARKGDGSLRR